MAIQESAIPAAAIARATISRPVGADRPVVARRVEATGLVSENVLVSVPLLVPLLVSVSLFESGRCRNSREPPGGGVVVSRCCMLAVTTSVIVADGKPGYEAVMTWVPGAVMVSSPGDTVEKTSLATVLVKVTSLVASPTRLPHASVPSTPRSTNVLGDTVRYCGIGETNSILAIGPGATFTVKLDDVVGSPFQEAVIV